jgi:hypothetical protein
MDQDRDAAPPLDFDTMVPLQAGDAGPAAPGGVACATCQQLVTDQYFDVNGSSVCGTCRLALSKLSETPRGMSALARAGLFGLVAAILGAVLYYAVIAITDFEIGLVAIAIGYMVGYGVRMGARGRGGRRFQVLALVLTYWAVGLAYSPFAFNAAAESAATPPAANGSAAPQAPEEPPQPAEADAAEGGSALLAVAVLLGITLALPVLSVMGSLPGGLISAAIIAFGMHQAWRMTGVPVFQITGPFRIGAAPSTSA